MPKSQFPPVDSLLTRALPTYPFSSIKELPLLCSPDLPVVCHRLHVPNCNSWLFPNKSILLVSFIVVGQQCIIGTLYVPITCSVSIIFWYMLDHMKSKIIPEKNLLLLHWLHFKAFDSVDHNKLENSYRDGNTRPSYLPPEKPVCRSRSNSENWTWNDRLLPNRKRGTSRLYTVTLTI